MAKRRRARGHPAVRRAMHTPQHRHRRRRGRYGNPANLEQMIQRQLDPGRAAWQRPDEVVRALPLRPGHVVAEIGSGPGFFTPRLARVVGTGGRVFAVDPEPAMLEHLRGRLAAARIANVTPVLGRGDDPLLPPTSCHLALMVNAYHHITDGPAFLARLAQVLRRGGRLVNIDWVPRETPVGPPLERRVPREAFLQDAARAGFVLAREHEFLPHQYFLVLRRRS
jgi:arsenite methyltransferase